MAWVTRPEQKQANPAQKFLQWKSDKQCFEYYDKAKEENVEVKLPLNIVILEHYHTVKGWDDATESGIYSNEVFAIGTDELTVKSFGGQKGNARTLAKGLYKDIKNEVKSQGAHYCRSIYAVSADQELINISLKGSGVSAYSDFVNNVLNGDQNFDKQWIKITEAKEMKKGKVSYSVPVFEKGKAINDKSKLQPFADTLQDYMVKYTGDKENVLKSKSNETTSDDKDDDLPF